MSKFCSKCGTALEDDALFCPECGSSVDETARKPAAQQSIVPTPAQGIISNKLKTGAWITAFLLAVAFIVCSFFKFRNSIEVLGFIYAGIAILCIVSGIFIMKDKVWAHILELVSVGAFALGYEIVYRTINMGFGVQLPIIETIAQIIEIISIVIEIVILVKLNKAKKSGNI